MNMNKKNNNPYGHLLDKYLDSKHVDWRTREQREKEAKEKYGNLLDKAKPDYSTLELIEKIEDEQFRQQRQKKREQELERQRMQMRIENARETEERHAAKVRGYAESILANKEAKVKAEQKVIAEKRKAEERQQEMHDTINGLLKISPESADAYIQALKKANAI